MDLYGKSYQEEQRDAVGKVIDELQRKSKASVTE
jgi:hypothetical protein